MIVFTFFAVYLIYLIRIFSLINERVDENKINYQIENYVGNNYAFDGSIMKFKQTYLVVINEPNNINEFINYSCMLNENILMEHFVDSI